MLLEEAQFLNERTFTDIYYDTAQYALTTKDKWLRSRENKFELKLPLGEDRLFNQYEELETEEEIRKALLLPKTADLIEDLTEAGYEPFCVCATTRKKYKKGAFVIDLDTVEFGEFTYSVGEIELMVEDRGKTEEAIQKITEFAKGYGLQLLPVRGKVLEYLKRVKPEHFETLVHAGVVQKGNED